VEKLLKTLRIMEKKASMEHQSPSVWGVAKRKHKYEKTFWMKNLSLNFVKYVNHSRHVSSIYYFTYIHEIYLTHFKWA